MATKVQRTLGIVGIGCLAIGLLGVGIAVYHLVAYIVDFENPLRGEQMIGAGIGFVIALWPFLAASAIALVIESGVSDRLFRWLFVPGAIWLGLTLVLVTVELLR